MQLNKQIEFDKARVKSVSPRHYNGRYIMGNKLSPSNASNLTRRQGVYSRADLERKWGFALQSPKKNLVK